MHDDLVAMVDKMLELQKKLRSVRLESDKKLYKTQIHLLDNQIDSHVYKLYGLTDEEIKIIEKTILLFFAELVMHSGKLISKTILGTI